jgi:hypothetical protein
MDDAFNLAVTFRTYSTPKPGGKVYSKYKLAVLLLLTLPAWQWSSQNPMVVKARRDGKSLYLSVLVNGKGPFWFAVDSGAHHSVIDPYVMAQTGLKSVSPGTVTGTGTGEVPVEHVGRIRMQIGNLALPIPDPLVIDLSTTPNPKWLHGLVGAELFEAYVVEMDYEKNQFRIFDPEDFLKPSKASAIPLIVENHRMFIDLTIEVSDQKTVTHRVRVDTGSEDSVNDEVVKEGSHVRETTLGNGLGENFKGYSGVYKAIHLGPFRFQNVWGPGAPHPGIGMEMFRRFTVTFDAPHKLLYLEPNRNFPDAFPPPAGQ